MTEPFEDFEWHVAPAYHWQDWLNERGKPVVVRRHGMRSLESPSAVEAAWQHSIEANQLPGPVLGPVLDSGPARTYKPMSRKHAALFQTFARLDHTDTAAIHGFASTYGLLGVDRQEQQPFIDGSHFPYVVGESYLSWAREICSMQEALRIARTRSPAEQAEIAEAWGKFGLKPPDEEERRKLTWLFNVHLQHVQGRMVIGADVQPRLSFVPQNLLAAMWLQLALAVAGDKQFRQCKFCRRLIEISTDDTGFRSHREFCSGTCKTNDYRRRRRMASALADKKTPATKIAAQLATDEATIARWLSRSKSGPRRTK